MKEDENDAYDAYEEVQHFPYVVTRLPVVRQTFQFFGWNDYQVDTHFIVLYKERFHIQD